MNFLDVGDGQGTPSVSLRRILTDAALAQPVPVFAGELVGAGVGTGFWTSHRSDVA
jgi:hypothetical protein